MGGINTAHRNWEHILKTEIITESKSTNSCVFAPDLRYLQVHRGLRDLTRLFPPKKTVGS